MMRQDQTADLDNGDLVLKNLTKGVEIPVQHTTMTLQRLYVSRGKWPGLYQQKQFVNKLEGGIRIQVGNSRNNYIDSWI